METWAVLMCCYGIPGLYLGVAMGDQGCTIMCCYGRQWLYCSVYWGARAVSLPIVPNTFLVLYPRKNTDHPGLGSSQFAYRLSDNQTIDHFWHFEFTPFLNTCYHAFTLPDIFWVLYCLRIFDMQNKGFQLWCPSLIQSRWSSVWFSQRIHFKIEHHWGWAVSEEER